MACDHIAKQPKRGNPTYTNGQTGVGYESTLQAWGDRDVSTVFRDTCGKCGARRIDRQIGLEPTPDEYLATMVAVFREVRRVLRKDGTLWLNIGDSYAASSYGSGGGWAKTPAADGIMRNNRSLMDEPFKVRHGAKPKDLMMMPARLALALQADGWWVRSDIIWHKPNPMPESCTDRPTSAHEHVFLLTRSARYYYDAEAVREPHSRDWWNEIPSRPGNPDRNDGGGRQASNESAGRNLRNVWTIPTSPFSAAHFATYPPALAERCIRAGTSERGACSQCGKPWVREVDKKFTPTSGVRAKINDFDRDQGWEGVPYGTNAITTTGWSPACACNAEVRPCVVLDPFAGAGTTLLVGDRLQRDAIGIELNPSYTEMAMQRCRDDAPLFTAFPPAEDPETERMADLFANLAAD